MIIKKSGQTRVKIRDKNTIQESIMTSTTSSQHFALVSCPNGASNPLKLENESSSSSSSSSSSDNDPRSELIDLYQSYAEMYPNPKLIEEIRLKDMLLQASTAANSAKKSENNKLRLKLL